MNLNYPLYEDIVDVKLVGYTQTPLDITMDDKTLSQIVAFCARVSNPSNQNNNDTASKLLKYLAKNKHWSPFEMVNINVEITTTRDIARQILRHRSFAFQEFSQRYADPTKELQFCLKPYRLQDVKNRQNSLDVADEKIKEGWLYDQEYLINSATTLYHFYVKQGGAKECIRAILPEGNTVSRMYMNGSLRSWIHYLDVRLDPSTQYEHRIVAEKIKEIIVKLVPEIFET